MSIEGLIKPAIAAGVGLQVAGTLQQGRDIEAIAESRAAIDRQSADVADVATTERAKIIEEKRRKAVAAGKSAIAASGVKLGGSLDAVTQAEINRAFFADKKFSTASGREESSFLRSRADIEVASGRAARKRSKRSAFARGAFGLGSIAFMGT